MNVCRVSDIGDRIQKFCSCFIHISWNNNSFSVQSYKVIGSSRLHTKYSGPESVIQV